MWNGLDLAPFNHRFFAVSGMYGGKISLRFTRETATLVGVIMLSNYTVGDSIIFSQ
jgi:hypothetical protein